MLHRRTRGLGKRQVNYGLFIRISISLCLNFPRSSGKNLRCLLFRTWQLISACGGSYKARTVGKVLYWAHQPNEPKQKVVEN